MKYICAFYQIPEPDLCHREGLYLLEYPAKAAVLREMIKGTLYDETVRQSWNAVMHNLSNIMTKYTEWPVLVLLSSCILIMVYVLHLLFI
jgi:hypothetical protein